jgi:hypothetical protein
MDEKLSKTKPDGAEGNRARQEAATNEVAEDERRGSRWAGLRNLFTKFSRTNVDAEEAGGTATVDAIARASASHNGGDRRDRDDRDNHRRDGQKRDASKFSPANAGAARGDSLKPDAAKAEGNQRLEAEAPIRDATEQLGREVRIGLAIVSILLLIFGYVFVRKISGDGKSARIALPGEEPKVVDAQGESHPPAGPPASESSAQIPTVVGGDAPSIAQRHAPDAVCGVDGRVLQDDLHSSRNYDSDVRRDSFLPKPDRQATVANAGPTDDRRHTYDKDDLGPTGSNNDGIAARTEQDDIPAARGASTSPRANDVHPPTREIARELPHDAAQDLNAQRTPAHSAVREAEPHAAPSDDSADIAAAISEKYSAGKYSKPTPSAVQADSTSIESSAVAANVHASDNAAGNDAASKSVEKPAPAVRRDDVERDEAPAYATEAPHAAQSYVAQEDAAARDVAARAATIVEGTKPASTETDAARTTADRDAVRSVARDSQTGSSNPRGADEQSQPRSVEASELADDRRALRADRGAFASAGDAVASVDRRIADDRAASRATASRDADASAEASDERQSPPRTRLYTVREGETIYDIARHELGRVARWKEIVALNQESIGEDIEAIEPGLRIRLPDERHGASVARGLDDLPWR